MAGSTISLSPMCPSPPAAIPPPCPPPHLLPTPSRPAIYPTNPHSSTPPLPTQVPNVPGLLSMSCSANIPNVQVRSRNCAAAGSGEFCYEAAAPHCPRGVCPFVLNCVASVNPALLPGCCRAATSGAVTGSLSGAFTAGTFNMPVRQQQQRPPPCRPPLGPGAWRPRPLVHAKGGAHTPSHASQPLGTEPGINT